MIVTKYLNRFFGFLKKFLYIIGPKNKKKLKKIFFVNLIISIFEFLSISLIIPVIVLLVKNDISSYLTFSPSLQSYMNSLNLNNQIILILIMINIVFLLRYFLIVNFNKTKIRFINKVFENISGKVFIGNILSSYENLIGFSSSEIVKNIYHECVEFNKNILSAIISISGEVMKIIAILIILLWVDYFAVISGVLFFGIFSLLFLGYQKRKVRIWGVDSLTSFEKIIQFINEGFASIKEIKLIKNKKFFFDHYKFHLNKFTDSKFKKEVLSQLARPLLELLFIILITSLILIKIYFSNSSKDIIILLSVFTLGFVRLLPSTMKIINDTQSIFYSLATIESIKKRIVNFHELENKKDIVDNNLDNIESIELEKINYKYPNTNKDIIKNFSKRFERGKIYGISGVSGSGKTTLVSIMMGFLKPLSGVIKINDQVSSIYDNQFYYSQISYVPQKIFVSNDTLKNNISLGEKKEEVNHENINKLIDTTNLTELNMKLEKNLETLSEMGKNISEGQKQRLGFARALYLNRQIIFLDEFTSSLDTNNEKKLVSKILDLKKDKIIIIIAHNMNILKICDEIIQVKNVT